MERWFLWRRRPAGGFRVAGPSQKRRRDAGATGITAAGEVGAAVVGLDFVAVAVAPAVAADLLLRALVRVALQD